ncbi:MAG: hypothetical protein BWY76_02595 [bacterium ADurb.Bin429]|nr:MAG: hypothetical protein BWY76_02595 [bacterium ADurb.Bin429]
MDDDVPLDDMELPDNDDASDLLDARMRDDITDWQHGLANTRTVEDGAQGAGED